MRAPLDSRQPTDTRRAGPNARGEPRPTAAATQERRLLGVGSTALLGSPGSRGTCEVHRLRGNQIHSVMSPWVLAENIWAPSADMANAVVVSMMPGTASYRLSCSRERQSHSFTPPLGTSK